MDFTIAGGVLKGAYAAGVQGLTSTPALYGTPVLVSTRRVADEQARLDRSRQAHLERLTRGLAPEIQLPKIKL